MLTDEKMWPQRLFYGDTEILQPLVSGFLTIPEGKEFRLNFKN